MAKLPPINPALEPVWLPYGRKSHPNERDDQKLTEREQEQACLAWVKRQVERAGRGELDATPWEFDDDTGQNAERPAYQRRLARARALRLAGRQVYWLVRQFDRIGRDAEELHRAYKELCALDVELHDVSMGGYVSPQVFPYLVANAHVGSITIGSNVKRTNGQVRRDGWWRPANRPWGYAIVAATGEQRAKGSPKNVLTEHPEEAETVREAWRRCAAGVPLHRISRWLAGLPSAQRGGRVLGRAALTVLFRSRLYVAEQPDGAPGNWPALVDRDTWELAQAKLDGARRAAPAQASGEYLLTGRLFCPRCGARMRGSARPGEPGKRSRYQCSSVTSGAHYAKSCTYSCIAPEVEQDVLRQVAPLLALGRGERAELAGEVGRLLGAQRPADSLQGRLEAAEATIALAKRRSNNLFDALSDGTISKAEFSEQVAPHRALRDEGEAEKARVQAELDATAGGPAGRRRLSVQDVMGQYDAWRLAWADAGEAVPHRRAVLVELVAHVEPVKVAHGRWGARVLWSDDGQLLAAAAGLALAPGQEATGDGLDASAAG